MDCVTVNSLRSGVRYIGIPVITGLAVWVVSSSVVHLHDPEFMPETYCQINSLNKEGEDVVDEELNNTCKSDIVLKYTPEYLERHMKRILWSQATLGLLLLAVTSVLAIVGLCRIGTGTCLMNIWLFFNGPWCVSLAVSAWILEHDLSYHRYANTLIVFLIISVVPFLCKAVEYCCQKTRVASDDPDLTQRRPMGSLHKLPEAVPMQDMGGSECDEAKTEDDDETSVAPGEV